MDAETIRQMEQMLALVAEMNSILAIIEGMKVLNAEMQICGVTFAYSEDAFADKASELAEIANQLWPIEDRLNQRKK